MESMSLVQINNLQFRDTVATLVGVEPDLEDESAEEHVKQIFFMTGISYKYEHRTKGTIIFASP